MKRFFAILLLAVIAFVAGRFSQQPDVQAQEGDDVSKHVACGDINGDGGVNVSDVVYFVRYLFVGGPELVCEDEPDAQ